MHPLGCGGHQHPPSRSCGLPAAGQLCRQSRQATGPRRRARPGRVAGDGQPARLGLPGWMCKNYAAESAKLQLGEGGCVITV